MPNRTNGYEDQGANQKGKQRKIRHDVRRGKWDVEAAPTDGDMEILQYRRWIFAQRRRKYRARNGDAEENVRWCG
jgi:hypothetical protein